jgi:endonuclease/exonuclease/phosphatase family metal-dependent hydrolase
MSDRRRRRRRRLLAGLLVVLVLVWWCGRAAPVVLGTFNIRMFIDAHTCPDEVAEAVAELDADAFAVQEIRDVEAFARVLADAGAWTGREYAMVMVPYCRTHARDFRLGVVYDARRLDLVTSRPFAADGACADEQPHGMVAVLRGGDGREFGLASVHMTALGTPEAIESRRQQWTWLVAALPRWTHEILRVPVVVAGDFNSTGYLQADSDEREFIDRTVEREGLQLPTGELDCSEYWEPQPGNFAVSLLDHVLAPADWTFAAPEVLGMCAQLQCAPQVHVPPGFDTVSDHCPVRIAWTDG